MADLLTELSSRKPQSTAARLRALLPEINAAQADGYTHVEILAALKQLHGLDISFEVYQTTLSRIRKPPKRKTHAPTATAPAKTITAQALPAAKNSNPSFEFDKTPSDNLWE
ncbi:hypothetical protein [Iodobacter fluviatilis]|uniref:Uncharacterized protein n=1 Tax=Iodobacter fluviatilis TaxID=537 RepID=A0A7G3GB59_9NEIS|nr:hypothetical protein [Iodobacter fluviatilis]QBC44429.1 hypothetical protein C1H71_13420 [Iodobacter fluviatilis]